MSEPKVSRCTRPTLVARGWTDALIAEFLGEPDAFATNPHYRTGPKMRLYDLSRVLEAEKREDFIARRAAILAKRPTRRKAAAAVSSRKLATLFAWVDNLNIVIPSMPLERLYSLALGRRVVEGLDNNYVARKCANYLRHEVTSYDDLLLHTFGQTGTEEACTRLRQRIQGKICEAYPSLAAGIVDADRKREGYG
jgi:hypothetical protein